MTGVSWRASIGFDLNPELPYAIATGTDTPTGDAPWPNQPRFFGFAGVRYTYAGP